MNIDMPCELGLRTLIIGLRYKGRLFSRLRLLVHLLIISLGIVTATLVEAAEERNIFVISVEPRSSAELAILESLDIPAETGVLNTVKIGEDQLAILRNSGFQFEIIKRGISVTVDRVIPESISPTSPTLPTITYQRAIITSGDTLKSDISIKEWTWMTLSEIQALAASGEVVEVESADDRAWVTVAVKTEDDVVMLDSLGLQTKKNTLVRFEVTEFEKRKLTKKLIEISDRGSSSGANSSNIPIYDHQTAWSTIYISSAPSYAVATSIDIYCNIDHDWTRDLIIWAGTASYSTGNLAYHPAPTGNDWADGYNETYENTFYSIPVTNSQPVNQGWLLAVADDATYDEGRIDKFEITVYWETAEITSLAWSHSDVCGGTDVELRVWATGYNGQTLIAEILEKDDFGIRQHVDYRNIYISGGYGYADWESDWIYDILGIGDPEFVFEVEGEESGELAVRDCTPPGTPVLISPGNGWPTSDNTVALDWSDVTDEDSGLDHYQLQVDNNSNFSSPEVDVDRSSSSYTTPGLATDQWYWRVRAFDNRDNYSNWSSVRNFYVDTSDPSTPSLILPADDSTVCGNCVSFDWSNSTDTGTGVEYYIIQVDDGITFLWPEIENTYESSNCQICDLGTDTWHWRVRAVDGVGNQSNWSSVYDFDQDMDNPTASLSSPSEGTEFDICTPTLSWSGSDNGSGICEYRLVVDNNSNFSSPEVDQYTASTSFTIPCQPDDTYYWRVRPKDCCGNWGTWTGARSFSINTVEIESIYWSTTNTIGSAVTQKEACTTIFLNVEAAGLNGQTLYASIYENYWGVIGEEPQTGDRDDLVDVVSIPVTGSFGSSDPWYIPWMDDAAGGPEYYFVITVGSESTQSPDLSADDTTAPLPPVLQYPSNGEQISTNPVEFNWADATDCTGIEAYRIQVATDSGFSNIIADEEVEVSSINLVMTDGSDAYYWHVRAKDNMDHWGAYSQSSHFSLSIDPLPTGEWSIIIHGFTGSDYGSIVDDWMAPLAEYIMNDLDPECSSGGDCAVEIHRMDAETLQLLHNNDSHEVLSEQDIRNDSVHHILLYNWAETCGLGWELGPNGHPIETEQTEPTDLLTYDGYAYSAADVLYSLMTHYDLEDNVFCLLGYSRGAVVASEYMRRAALNNVDVEQVIFIDGEGGGSFGFQDNRFEAWDAPGEPPKYENIYTTYGDGCGGHSRINTTNFNLGDEYSHAEIFWWDPPKVQEFLYVGGGLGFDGSQYVINWEPELPISGNFPDEDNWGGTAHNPDEFLFNGNLEWNSKSGWKSHGAFGDGHIDAIGDNYIELDHGNEELAHTYLYVQPHWSHLNFEYEVTDGGTNDIAKLRLRTHDSQQVQEYVIDHMNGSVPWTDCSAGVPEEMRGELVRVEFSLEDTQQGDVWSSIRIDDVRFVQCDEPLPPSNVAANPQIIVPGETVTLTATTPEGITTVWYIDDCGVGLVGSGASIQVTPFASTTYYARARNTSTGCVSDNCSQITVTVIESEILVQPTIFSVHEGEDESCTVRLTENPHTNITIFSERVSGDEDLGITSGEYLQFNSSDWNVPQEVTIHASQDADTDNGLTLFRASVVTGPSIPSEEFTVSEIDDDILSIVVEPNELFIPENQSRTLAVSLNAEPSSTIDIEVVKTEGDIDIVIVQGAILTFNSSNWSYPQTVSVVAEDDADAHDGTAVITARGVSGPAVLPKMIPVAEVDDDELEILLSANTIEVPEGGENTFTALLTAEPLEELEIQVVRLSGDTDLTVSLGASLFFNSGNWSVAQEIQISAEEDADNENGSAVFRVSCPSEQSIPHVDVTATEVDNDRLQFVLQSSSEVSIPEGGTEDITLILNEIPDGEVLVEATFQMGDQGFNIISGANLTFNESNWDVPHTITVAASQDENACIEQDILEIESSSHPTIPLVEVMVTSIDDDMFSITGTVTNLSTGLGLSDAAIVGLPETVTTNSSGNYLAHVPCDWSGTIHAELSCFSFTPEEIIIDPVSEDLVDQNFSGEHYQYLISGTILDNEGLPIQNVVVSNVGGDVTDDTDTNGYYSVLVDCGWNDDLIPVHSEYIFDPLSRHYDEVLSPQENQDYTGHIVPDELVVMVPNGGEVWAIGAKGVVSWNYNLSETIDVELSRSGLGGPWETLASDIPSDNRMWKWESISGSPSEDCYIRLTDSNTDLPFDICNSVFSIIDLGVPDWSFSMQNIVVYSSDGCLTDLSSDVWGVPWEEVEYGVLIGDVETTHYAGNNGGGPEYLVTEYSGQIDSVLARQYEVDGAGSGCWQYDGYWAGGLRIQSPEEALDFATCWTNTAIWQPGGECPDSDNYGKIYDFELHLYRRDTLFTDVAPTRGIDDCGKGGGAWCDYDEDGDLDLFVTRIGSDINRCHLYNNDGGYFTDVAVDAGIDTANEIVWGAAWADYDNDGQTDLYLSIQDGANRLYRNDGGTFTDVAPPLGLNNAGAGRAAAWIDVNNDGWLDLYVINYSGANTFYLNNGASTSFTDATGSFGLEDDTNGRTLACADYDDDGWVDIFLTNYSGACRLFHNQGGTHFTDKAPEYNMDLVGIISGAAWADFNRDGMLDLYVGWYLGDNHLFKQYRVDGVVHFAEVAEAAGVSDPDGTRKAGGVDWGDFNNDGWIDLYVANFGDNRLYENQRDGTFIDRAVEFGCNDLQVGRDVSWSDFDQDGDLDLFVVNDCDDAGNRCNLFLNNLDPTPWLKVVTAGLAGTGTPMGSNRSGIGAQVFMVSDEPDSFVAVSSVAEDFMAQSLMPVFIGYHNLRDVTGVAVSYPGAGIVESDLEFTGITHHDAPTPDQLLSMGEFGFTVAGDQVGTTISLQILAYSAHYTNLTYTIIDGYQSDMTIDAEGTFTWMNPGAAGTYYITVRATDPEGSYADIDLTLEVLEIYHQFNDIAAAAGVAVNSVGRSSGWGRIGDHDLDDLFVVVNGGASHLFRNNGNQTFSDRTDLLEDFYNEPVFSWGFTDPWFLACSGTPDMDPPDGIDWDAIVRAEVYISSLTAECCGLSDSEDPSQFSIYHGGEGSFSKSISVHEVYDPDHDDCFSHGASASGWYRVTNPSQYSDITLDFSLNPGPPCGLTDTCQPNAYAQGSVQLFEASSAPTLSATWGNANGDRYLDLFIGNHSAPDLLYIWNTSTDSYTEVAAAADVAGSNGSTRGITWLDLNGDGFLDIQTSRNELVNNFYLNTSTSTAIGDISFTDIGVDSLGMTNIAWTRSSSWGDFDNDGDLDLYVVNLDSANKFYIFEDGTCTEQSVIFGVDDTGWGLGSAWGDFDNDGDLDLYLTNNYTPNRLFVNTLVESGDGTPGFTEDAAGHGVADPWHSRSCAWLDFDNDGDLDLHVLNSDDPDRMYVNDGGIFTDQAGDLGLDDGDDCVSGAWADFDQDGDLDVYISKEGAPNSLYENVGNMNSWLHVDVNWPGLQTWPAVGSRVRVVTGELAQIRVVTSATGYMSQHSLPVEFGFGSGITTVDSVEITIPGGGTYVYLDVPVNEMLTAPVSVVEITPGAYQLAQNYPNPFNPRTDISFFMPESGQVDLVIYDIAGRRVRSLARAGSYRVGVHTLTWDGLDDVGQSVSSGVYFYRLSAGSFTKARKMLLLR